MKHMFRFRPERIFSFQYNQLEVNHSVSIFFMSLQTLRKIKGSASSTCLLYCASMWNLLNELLKANVGLHFIYSLPKQCTHRHSARAHTQHVNYCVSPHLLYLKEKSSIKWQQWCSEGERRKGSDLIEVPFLEIKNSSRVSNKSKEKQNGNLLNTC